MAESTAFQTPGPLVNGVTRRIANDNAHASTRDASTAATSTTTTTPTDARANGTANGSANGPENVSEDAAEELRRAFRNKYRHVQAVHSQSKPSCLSHESTESPSFLGFRNLMVIVLGEIPIIELV